VLDTSRKSVTLKPTIKKDAFAIRDTLAFSFLTLDALFLAQ
jgi:hypothetical protein